MPQGQIWLVTGASSGFGRLVTEIALNKGNTVVATARKPETLSDLTSRYDSDHLLPLRLDVTNADDITVAFAKVAEVYGRLDVVFNNAGQSLRGEVEACPGEKARALFESNFWGAAEVSIQAVKFFREVNQRGVGGRLLNMSSVLGIKAWPLAGYYSAAKHALEAVTKALVAELNPEWSIKITLIEPGLFKTEIDNKGIEMDPPPAYFNPFLGGMQMRKTLRENGSSWADPRPAALMIYTLAQLPDPPLRLPIGLDALEGIREELKQIQADVNSYASWTDKMVQAWNDYTVT